MRAFRWVCLALLCAPTCATAQGASNAANDAAGVPAYMLLQTSITALRARNIKVAAFAFYAGQLRRRLEMGLFPPDNEGDESEAVYALQTEIGQVLNLAAFDDPKASLEALDEYDRWTPVIEPGFKPSWKCSHPAQDAGTVRRQITATKKDFSFHMRQQMTLMEDPVYYKQFHVGRDCNLQPEGKRPTSAACKAATAEMLRIEKERGVEGVATSAAQGG